MNGIKDRGIQVCTDVITVEEAKREILNWAKNEELIK